MILRLLGRNPLFVAGCVVSAASFGMLTVPIVPLQWVGLSTLLLCPVFIGTPTPFEAVIPVDARRFLITRIALGLALMCLPLIAWVVAGYLHTVPADGATAALLTPGPAVRLVSLPIAALAVILPHVRHPGVLPRPGDSWFPTLPWWAAVALGSAAAIGWLPLGLAFVVLTAAAVAALALTWRRMPRSYQVAPAAVEHAGWNFGAASRGLTAAGAARRAPSADRASAETPAVPSWRSLLSAVIPRRMVFIILLAGGAGITDQWLFYLLILWFPDLLDRARFRWLHTLPVPRTWLLWTRLAPVVVSLFLIALSGGVVGPALLPELDALDEGGPHQYSRVHDFDRSTRVPLTYWRIAPDGAPPVVRAPWGETTTTDTVALPGLTLFNPYSARKGSSPELIEWQFGRAAAAIHGRSFTSAEYHADGFVPPRRVARSVQVYLLGGSLALTFVLLIIWLVELTHWHALATRSLLRYGVGTVAAALVIGIVVLDLFGMFRHSTAIVIPLGAAIALRVAAALPNTALVAVVAALPVLAAYSLLRWQIGRSDVA